MIIVPEKPLWGGNNKVFMYVIIIMMITTTKIQLLTVYHGFLYAV